MVVVDVDGSIGQWLCARTGGEYSPQCVTFGNVVGGKLVGAVMFDHYNGASMAVHCAGDGGKWITRDLLRAVFGYAFDHAKVNKLIGFVDSSNEAARKLDEHLGFTLESRISAAAPDGDLLLFTMTREQCRFLGDKHGQQVRLTAKAA